MKRILNGKRYDTETAERVASWESTYDTGDFHYCSEGLYRTRGGSWFLAGSGGAASKYRRTVALNEWTGGEDIAPLTETEAQEWLEEHGKTEALEKYFGGAIEDA